MAKGSKRLAFGFLLLPLVYALLLRSNIPPLHLWKLQLSHWPSSSLSFRSDNSGINGAGWARFPLRSLVQGRARRELNQNGVSCIFDPESNVCVISDMVRITAGPSSSVTVYFTAGQRLHVDSNFTVRPYPRKTDMIAMRRTSPVRFVSGKDDPPPCDVTHPIPAVVFSTGGFAGNFFHDINDVIIPLFITAGHFQTQVRLVITDFESWWVAKYHRVLAHLSSYDVVVASSPSSAVEGKVHCFPGAVVGLKYHDNLACKSTDVPGGVSIIDFRRFLHESFGLKWKAVGVDTGEEEPPVLVLISRRKSRTLLNEDGVVQLAEEMGFRVELAPPQRMANVQSFAELVNSCTVLMGVHGAGMTNMVFLRPGAVLLQVVPWGLDWASKTYYAQPAQQMGLNYVEYKSAVEESTLYTEYPRDDPVLTDPWSIHLKGYNVSKPVYTDGQSLRLDLSRFRETLLQAKQFLPHPSV